MKYSDWRIIAEQCSRCKWWSDEDGCLEGNGIDPDPYENCNLLDEK